METSNNTDNGPIENPSCHSTGLQMLRAWIMLMRAELGIAIPCSKFPVLVSTGENQAKGNEGSHFVITGLSRRP